MSLVEREGSTMKLGFNGATTMKASLLEDAWISKEAGFEYFELRDNKLEDLLKTKSLEEIKSFFRSLSIQPIAMNSLERATLQDEEGLRKVLERAETLCKYSAALDCPILIVVPSFLESADTSVQALRQKVKEDAISVLRKLERLAQPYEVKIAFEFLGFVNSSVNTLSFCNEIVSDLDSPNVGLTIDTFHFFLSGEPLSVLESVDPAKIFLIHVADIENIPRAQLSDANRTIPGEGVAPLKAFVRKLQEIGYQGVFSIELFNPKYWERDPKEVAVLCYQKMRELFQ